MVGSFASLRVFAAAVFAVLGFGGSQAQSLGIEPSSRQVGAQAKDIKVLGFLGRANKKARIYLHPKEGPTSYLVSKGQYLVVQDRERVIWTKVLLKSGQTGFIRSSTVELLPFSVSVNPKLLSWNPNNPSFGGEHSDLRQWCVALLGTPYKKGGSDLTGYGSSEFVAAVFGYEGRALPVDITSQSKVGIPVTRIENLRRGDRLYFWSEDDGKLGSVGIYDRDGFFFSSDAGRGAVCIRRIDAESRKTLVSARR